jgi:hypothetical protein
MRGRREEGSGKREKERSHSLLPPPSSLLPIRAT